MASKRNFERRNKIALESRGQTDSPVGTPLKEEIIFCAKQIDLIVDLVYLNLFQ
jgi:hypothetical protein